MRPILPSLLSMALLLSLAPGCRSVSKQTKEDLAAPIHCTTAKRDIMFLEGEKASTEKRIREGVSAVMPTQAVVNLLTHDEKDSVEVAAGVYNDRIDQKIAEIKHECGIGQERGSVEEQAHALAQQLSQQSDALFNQADAERSLHPDLVYSTQNYLIVQDLRTLRDYTAVLTRHLDRGDSMAETEPLFRRIETIVLDLRSRSGKSALLLGFGNLVSSTRATFELLAQLYDADASE